MQKNVFSYASFDGKIRQIQSDIIDLYGADAAKYESESSRKLRVQRIYSMIPSNMENRKKRMTMTEIDGRKGVRTSTYSEEFDYLTASSIALEVDAISNPTYPLNENAGKNLLKLYLNDVGLLTCRLFGNNIKPVLEDIPSINLGSVYETVAAQELKAHGYPLFYFDSKKVGEVDFLIDDESAMSALPVEIKSGKDYTTHSALNRFLSNADYHVKRAYVMSNHRKVHEDNGIVYMPVYFLMFINRANQATLSI